MKTFIIAIFLALAITGGAAAYKSVTLFDNHLQAIESALTEVGK